MSSATRPTRLRASARRPNPFGTGHSSTPGKYETATPGHIPRKVQIRRALATMAGAVLVAVHLGGAYLGLHCLAHPAQCGLPPEFGVPPPLSRAFFLELLSELLLVGAFLYALLLAFRAWGRPRSGFARAAGGVFALSLAIAILLAADRSMREASASATPANISGLIYTLVTERQALLALALIFVSGIAIALYYLVRSAFAFEYSGSGVQIRLPGHTVYYVPVFPQVSWQDTGITLQKGEKVSIELSGLVSPGALHADHLAAWRDHMKAFVEWQARALEQPDMPGELPKPPETWPYTGPEGYLPEWYEGDQKLAVLEQHELYGKERFYEADPFLTVQGLTHNTVVGFIQPFGSDKPRNTAKGSPAYDWGKDEDRKQLLLLSSRRYPLEQQEIPGSGKLWVVINDVDFARWDNTGMFFLKLTRRAWL